VNIEQCRATDDSLIAGVARAARYDFQTDKNRRSQMFLGPLGNGGRVGQTYFSAAIFRHEIAGANTGILGCQPQDGWEAAEAGASEGEYRFDLRSVGEKSPLHSSCQQLPKPNRKNPPQTGQSSNSLDRNNCTRDKEALLCQPGELHDSQSRSPSGSDNAGNVIRLSLGSHCVKSGFFFRIEVSYSRQEPSPR
jgi:hypothetical protein